MQRRGAAVFRRSLFHYYLPQITTLMEDKTVTHQRTTILQLCNQECTQTLFRTISLLSNVSQVDNTLGEEIARAGCQAILKRVIDRIKEYITICEAAPPTCTTTTTTYSIEELLDKLMDYLDVACELYSPIQSKGMPFTNEEIESRLPLVYNLGPSTDAGDNNHQSTILISQVTARQSSQGDVGYVMWPNFRFRRLQQAKLQSTDANNSPLNKIPPSFFVKVRGDDGGEKDI